MDKFIEPTSQILKEIQLIKNDLIIKYGTTEPELLVSKDFHNKFAIAKQKFSYSMINDKGETLLNMCSMMHRAYIALDKQLKTEQIMPVPKDVWRLKHKETNKEILFCRTNKQIKSIKDKYRGEYIWSVEELLNIIPDEIINVKCKINDLGIEPILKKITIYDNQKV